MDSFKVKILINRFKVEIKWLKNIKKMHKKLKTRVSNKPSGLTCIKNLIESLKS